MKRKRNISREGGTPQDGFSREAGRKGTEMDIRIILASASPRRQELLRQVGLAPEVIPSHVDESGVGGTPEQMVMELSRRKAEDVAAGIRQKEQSPEACAMETPPENAPFAVIGADTVVAADGRILGKPKSKEEAAAMIRLLAGRTHHVYTGVTMVFFPSGEQITFAEGTEVEVYPMTEEQIRRYVATGEPMDKAGAYGIQGYFAAYVKGIRGDYNNVVGLPVARVCQELSDRGYF